MHIFKYLEIQAIKEDRKRGVLTDQEYRRSAYRKGSIASVSGVGGASNAPGVNPAAVASAASMTAPPAAGDLRFAANGFCNGNDPRRKRNTADSGYGSEQHFVDGQARWSQDFTQDVSV